MSVNVYWIAAVVVFNAGVLVATVAFLRAGQAGLTKALNEVTHRLSDMESKLIAMSAADPAMVEKVARLEAELVYQRDRAQAVGKIVDDRHIELVREVERIKVRLELAAIAKNQ